jgi:hypothetical protein
MSNKKQTAVKELAIAFREWQKDWDSFEKRRKDQPISFDHFIKPFLEKEKQQIIDSLHYFGIENAEEYYTETYGGQTYEQ